MPSRRVFSRSKRAAPSVSAAGGRTDVAMAAGCRDCSKRRSGCCPASAFRGAAVLAIRILAMGAEGRLRVCICGRPLRPQCTADVFPRASGVEKLIVVNLVSIIGYHDGEHDEGAVMSDKKKRAKSEKKPSKKQLKKQREKQAKKRAKQQEKAVRKAAKRLAKRLARAAGAKKGKAAKAAAAKAVQAGGAKGRAREGSARESSFKLDLGTCPCCGKHCPLSKPKCGKGRAVARKKRERLAGPSAA